MGQFARESGEMVPVTFLLCQPNEVVQVKDSEKENVSGVVLGSTPLKKPRKTKKFKVLKQFALPESAMKKGEKVSLESFQDCKTFTIVGTSKGKGFQGGVKRHNFRTARHTHGTKEGRHGSTGAATAPGRTKPGLKMPGHMGCDRITLKKRQVVNIDPKNHVVAIKGPVAGAIGSTVFLLKED